MIIYLEEKKLTFFVISSFFKPQVGSPTNPPWAPGGEKTRGQGSFDYFSPNYLERFKKETDCTFDHFLLRQGEPGTSQYILDLSR